MSNLEARVGLNVGGKVRVNIALQIEAASKQIPVHSGQTSHCIGLLNHNSRVRSHYSGTAHELQA